MSKPSDTPLTDGWAFDFISAGGVVRSVVLADRVRHLERACDQLRSDVAMLRGALERVANVPVDGNGRDYYWVGRDIARAALSQLNNGRSPAPLQAEVMASRINDPSAPSAGEPPALTQRSERHD